MLTCDGAGDNVSASVRVWGGGKCEEIAITPEGDSLGPIYSWVTYGMGFVPLEHEYKLMGMGPYASDRAAEETAKVFQRYLRLRPDGLAFQRGTRRPDALHARMPGARSARHAVRLHLCRLATVHRGLAVRVGAKRGASHGRAQGAGRPAACS